MKNIYYVNNTQSFRWLTAELYEVLRAAHETKEVALALEVASRCHSSLSFALLESHGRNVIIDNHSDIRMNAEVLMLFPVDVLSNGHASLTEDQLAYLRRHLLLRNLGHFLGMQAACVDVAHDWIIHKHYLLAFDRHSCWICQDFGIGDSVFEERKLGQKSRAFGTDVRNEVNLAVEPNGNIDGLMFLFRKKQNYCGDALRIRYYKSRQSS